MSCSRVKIAIINCYSHLQRFWLGQKHCTHGCCEGPAEIPSDMSSAQRQGSNYWHSEERRTVLRGSRKQKIKVGLQNDFKRHTLLVKQSTQYISSIFSLPLLWTYFWSLFLNSLSRNSLRIRYYDVDIRPQLSPGKQISANKTKRDASKADIHRTTNPIWVCRAKCFFYTPDTPWWSGDTAGTKSYTWYTCVLLNVDMRGFKWAAQCTSSTSKVQEQITRDILNVLQHDARADSCAHLGVSASHFTMAMAKTKKTHYASVLLMLFLGREKGYATGLTALNKLGNGLWVVVAFKFYKL